MARLCWAVAAFLTALHFAAALSAAEGPGPVQWEPWEVRLTAAGEHPWWTFPVTADFVHEASGTTLPIEGFWDGGSAWVIRFAPTAAGLWRYRARSRDPGLDGHTGAIEVRPPTPAQVAANANYRGHITIHHDGRFFQHADGTPFFLLADTLWAGNTARCGLGSDQDGPFFRYLEDRGRKGFTTILMQLFHGFGDYGYGRYPESLGQRNEGGKPFYEGVVSRLNPGHFRFLDKRMQAMWERGFAVATPTAWFGKTADCKFTLEDARRITSYLRVRYGVYNGLWALCGEYQYTFRDCGWTEDDIDALGLATRRHNPYRHPVSIHPSGRTDWPAPHNVQSSRPFHGRSWLDHHWLQTGQSIERLHNIAQRAEENRALTPTRPVFCSESFYDRAGDPQAPYHMRWQAWCAFLNGCAGYGYGAFGIWQFYDPDDPEGETGKRGGVPWQEALEFQGGALLQHVAAFLRTVEWWRLEPARRRLRVDGKPCPTPQPGDISPPQAAVIPGELWIVYIPRGNSGCQISLSPPADVDPARMRWYDPRKGVWIPVKATDPAEDGALPARPDPPDEDWVFVLDAQDGRGR